MLALFFAHDAGDHEERPHHHPRRPGDCHASGSQRFIRHRRPFEQRFHVLLGVFLFGFQRFLRFGRGCIGRRFVGESPFLLRLPDELQEECQADHGECRAGNVRERPDLREPVSVRGGEEELEGRERSPADQERRPDRQRLPPRTHRLDHVQRYEARQQRKLVPAHDADGVHGQVRDVGERDDRDAEPAVTDRGGVSDEANNRGAERRHAETDQHRAANGHGRTGPRRPFHERPEAKADQHGLNAGIAGQGPDGTADHGELTRFHRDVVKQHGGEHRPADGEQAEHRPVHECPRRHFEGHAVDGTGKHDGNDGPGRAGPAGQPAPPDQQVKQHQHRQPGHHRRYHAIAERIQILDVSERHGGVPGEIRRVGLRVAARRSLRSRARGALASFL